MSDVKKSQITKCVLSTTTIYLFKVYDIVVPWNDTVYPRDLNYTLEFQNSTGYLRLYSLHGYEYCCKDTGACLNIGERFCNDGSPPVNLYAQVDQVMKKYQLITEVWPAGFFGPYFPSFPSIQTDCDITVNGGDDDDKAQTTALVVTVIVLPLITFAIGVAGTLYWTKQKRDESKLSAHLLM